MKGFWKRAAMGLLAIAMLLCAACAAPEQEPEQEMQTDIAGADWRTYGQVSDAGTITRAGEQTSVLACVFDSGVEFYLDEETQTFFAEAVFPEKIEGAHDLFEALSLDDLNGDGDSDVQLMLTGQKLIWYYDAASVGLSPTMPDTAVTTVSASGRVAAVTRPSSPSTTVIFISERRAFNS